MRRIAGTFVLMVTVAAAPAATAQTQNTQPHRQAPAPARAAAGGEAENKMAAQQPNPAAMDQLLQTWAAQNGKLKTLVVSFTRVDESKAWGDKTEYSGNAYLQTPNLACLHFEKVERPKGQPATQAPHERIVCTGQEIRQYDFKTKQIFVFPLDRNEQKRALQEGPLPFLFNLKVEEAKSRWGMSLMGEDKDHYLVGVRPRFEKDKEVFSSAFIQLSKTTFLPDRMLLVDKNGKDTQDYRFSAVQANQPISGQYFQALNIKGWKVVVNPGPEQAAQAAPAPAGPQGRPQVGTRPAPATSRPR
jgi:TIGR03009 family protein